MKEWPLTTIYTLFKGESLNGNNALVDNISFDMDY